MNAGAQTFLDRHLPSPGLVAAAIRNADRSVQVRCDGNAMTTAQVEQAVAELGHASEALKRHRIEAATVCWTFEQACVYFARRPDGAALALFVARSGPQPTRAELLALLQAFRADGAA